MASFRPDGSPVHNTGRSSGIQIAERQQRQHFPNAAATRGLEPANARAPRGFGFGGPCPSPYPYRPHNYHQQFPALQGVSASLGAQVTPSLYSGGPNNTPQRMGTHSQLSDNFRRTSTVGERSREEEGLQSTVTPSDRFGMRGLMDVLSGRDPNVTALAVGIDTQTFDSYDNLYCTYNFPWSARSSNLEPQYQLPQCYIGNVPIPRLNAQTVSGLKLETIFFMFYSSPNDEAQLLAANELHNRGWVYHKQHRLWLTGSASEHPRIKTDTYERGSYVYFDPHKWSLLRKNDFTVFYDMLERRPVPPQP